MALALDDEELGVRIAGVRISNLRFADDISLLAESEVELQHLVGRVSQTSTRSGLIVSKPKTEVQCAGKGRPHCASYQSTSQQLGIRIASSLTRPTFKNLLKTHSIILFNVMSSVVNCMVIL